jgi:hypothetical protein
MPHRASYWKTTAIALGVFAVLLSAVVLLRQSGMAAPVAALGLAVLCLPAPLLVAVGGLVCLWRDAQENGGRPDLFARVANRTPKPTARVWLHLRALFGTELRAGDQVRVNALSDIRATLDAQGSLDGLPFMVEMEQFCDRVFTVHRRVDKINDMRNKTGLRRMRDTVTLSAVRCSGGSHGGCQAECQILWKSAWLTRVRPQDAIGVSGPTAPAYNEDAIENAAGNAGQSFVCQMTELWNATAPMSSRDPRQDIRTLMSGNLGILGFLLALLTRVFNRAQELRGGAGYPFMPPSATTGRTPSRDLQLDVGDEVIVRSKREIAATLINSRNKGLWFDRDMIRFCGQRAVVRKRIDRVIDERTGKMVAMKTPCVVLEDVIATGEFLRFCPQHEFIFWREIWLEPVRELPVAGDTSNRSVPTVHA